MCFEEIRIRDVADFELFEAGRCCGAGWKHVAAFHAGRADGARGRDATGWRDESSPGSYSVRSCRRAPYPTVACDEGKFACTHVQFADS
jgi:hypothetical protein